MEDKGTMIIGRQDGIGGISQDCAREGRITLFTHTGRVVTEFLEEIE